MFSVSPTNDTTGVQKQCFLPAWVDHGPGQIVVRESVWAAIKETCAVLYVQISEGFCFIHIHDKRIQNAKNSNSVERCTDTHAVGMKEQQFYVLRAIRWLRVLVTTCFLSFNYFTSRNYFFERFAENQFKTMWRRAFSKTFIHRSIIEATCDQEMTKNAS